MSLWKTPGEVRGRVWKSGPSSWSYEVTIGGEVYLTDSTGGWRAALEGCLEDVHSLARILVAGHELKQTWAEILQG